MSPATSQPYIDETTVLPVARIDAQEKEYVVPLREFLETNGCQVCINQESTQPVVYYIAAGDAHFVKGIFSSASVSPVRRLGIVIDSSLSDGENLVDENTKIVVVDPVHLSPADVEEIFSFFFAGTSAFFDKRRNRHEPFGASVPQGRRAPYEAVQPETVEGKTKHSDSSVEVNHDQLLSQGELPTIDPQQNILPDEDRKRIGNIISDVFSGDVQNAKESTAKKSYRRGRTKMRKNIWAILAAAFFVMIFPVVWYIASVCVAGGSFALIGSRIKNGDASGAGSIANTGHYWLYQSKLAFSIASVPLKLVGLTQVVRGQERLLSFLTDIAGALDETQKIAQQGKDVASILLVSHKDNDGSTPASSIERLRMSVVSVQSSLGLAQAQLATLLRDETFPFFIPEVSRLGKRSETTLTSIRAMLTYIDQVLTLYPHVAGFKEPKTYLVLLQNSNELRPTGGFIGSVGVAKFEEGFLSDFTIQDVYALDGQLKGHVDPPLPIRELLGNEHWYLRDSNWNPDFKISAERAIWFYEKETGGYVDGVIAMNVPVIVDILNATGPILLSDYNDRITAENFFGKSIFYTQANFFPGSTQKSDFLGTLARTIMTKITSEKDINPVMLFHAFAAGLGRRDILFMFKQEDLQLLIEHFGWGGRMFNENGCRGVQMEHCFFDPFAFVEANVSVSKVNYFVKHNSTREVVIDTDGKVTENITIRLRNTVNQIPDPNEKGIGGPYRTYARFMVPSETLVSDVTLDGTPIASRDFKSNVLPQVPYIEKAESPAGTHAVGVAFDVPPGSERNVRISYKHVSPLPFGRGGVILDLLWYKHPGVSDNIGKTIIRYPVFWVATDETHSVRPDGVSLPPAESGDAPVFLAKDGELEYNTTISKDLFIRLKFTK